MPREPRLRSADDHAFAQRPVRPSAAPGRRCASCPSASRGAGARSGCRTPASCISRRRPSSPVGPAAAPAQATGFFSASDERLTERRLWLIATRSNRRLGQVDNRPTSLAAILQALGVGGDAGVARRREQLASMAAASVAPSGRRLSSLMMSAFTAANSACAGRRPNAVSVRPLIVPREPLDRDLRHRFVGASTMVTKLVAQRSSAPRPGADLLNLLVHLSDAGSSSRSARPRRSNRHTR